MTMRVNSKGQTCMQRASRRKRRIVSEKLKWPFGFQQLQSFMCGLGGQFSQDYTGDYLLTNEQKKDQRNDLMIPQKSDCQSQLFDLYDIILQQLLMALRFDGKVVVVTGAGNGIGKEYALFFASRGAKVVVNDLGGSHSGQGISSSAADKVVEEIKAKGGVAVANYDSVEFGDKIIKTAVDAFGKVDVLLNNAGILRDISFQKMKDDDWNLIFKVHVYGAYKTTRAAWNLMREQGYGRIINTSSSSGLFGSFGQVNYSAAKLALHGFTQALAKEGEKRNVRVNTIAPLAASRMTQTVMPPDVLKLVNPALVVPLVAYLSHESCTQNGSVFEVGGGFAAKLRWQRTEGAFFDPASISPQSIAKEWSNITSFDRKNDYPTSGNDTFGRIIQYRQKSKL